MTRLEALNAMIEKLGGEGTATDELSAWQAVKTQMDSIVRTLNGISGNSEPDTYQAALNAVVVAQGGTGGGDILELCNELAVLLGAEEQVDILAALNVCITQLEGTIQGNITDAYTELGILLNPFQFTSPSQVSFPENAEDPVLDITTNREDAEIHLGYPAPAPDVSELILTPDAVGANPVTWYWKAMYSKSPDAFHSKYSNESSFTIGDDTNVLTAIGYANLSIPFWADHVTIMVGTTSGIYTKAAVINLSNGNIDYFVDGEFIVNNNQAFYDSIPIKYHPIPATYQAPAPTNISITPDAVGANPVTWYYKVVQTTSENKICELSEEQSYQQGDDTTELIFNCYHVDYDDVDLFAIIKGTTSGVYTNIVVASFTPPDGFVLIADIQLPFDLLTGADLPLGEEAIAGFSTQLQQLFLPYYDNDLFQFIDGVLGFISPPDYETPADTDKNNVYKVLAVASFEGEEIEQEIEVTVTNVSE